MNNHPQRTDKRNERWCIILRDLIDKKARQVDVAEGTGLKPQQINDYYNGKKRPSFDSLVKLAKYFEVSTDYILGAEPDFPSPKIDEIEVFKATGFNPESINELKRMVINDKADITFINQPESKYYDDKKLITQQSILNFIFSNEHFYGIIRALEYARLFSKAYEVYGELDGFGTADDISIRELHLTRAHKEFQRLIDDYEQAVFEQEEQEDK